MKGNFYFRGFFLVAAALIVFAWLGGETPTYAKFQILKDTSEQSEVLYTVEKGGGDKVKVLKKSKSWFQVKVLTKDGKTITGYIAKPKRKKPEEITAGETPSEEAAFFWQPSWPTDKRFFDFNLEIGYHNINYDLNGTATDSASNNIVSYSFYGLTVGLPLTLNLVTFPKSHLTIGFDTHFRMGFFRVKLSQTSRIEEAAGKRVSIQTYMGRFCPQVTYNLGLFPKVDLGIIGGVGIQYYLLAPDYKTTTSGITVFTEETEFAPHIKLAIAPEVKLAGYRLRAELGDRLFLNLLYSPYSETPSGENASGSSPSLDFIGFMNPYAQLVVYLPDDLGAFPRLLHFGGAFDYHASSVKFKGLGKHSDREFQDSKLTFGFWNAALLVGLSW